ncbi:carboxy terminal-processing peptidase [uncultured Polaribacter sp.]|uniref:carboxy terminal-processing peptidase n=1 Tax=uncultured Polaribacter sp. TaxID=174711 RepID=UPI002629705B|nr:carboxy terminal-processing peptidase [uncultured Polaribacter sp.]
MKTKQKNSILFLAFLLFFNSFYTHANDAIKNSDPEKDKILIYVLKNILTRGHFVVKDMNDDFSEQVFKSFIDGLDPSKRYFTQEDIKEFSKYKYEIDNQLLTDDVSFYNLVYGSFTEKIKNARSYYGELLAQPFNFKKQETIDLDFEKVPFAKNENELINYWRKQLKLNTLSRVQDKLDKQEDKAKKDKNYQKKSFKVLEKEARAEVLKNMDELYLRIEELEHEDWFSTFLNSVVGAFDPHTTYMAPRIKERFDQDMSGKLEGIGARLLKKGIYTEIFELVSGGPAWKQGELEAGDIILEVAQGELEPLDIVGMRLDDAIKFIKGKKGTEVRLTVKKKLDGSTKIISIIRDVVELEETFVKSTIVEKEGKKYGLIDLPRFYIDFADSNSRDSAKDMEKEIARLKEENVSGLLIDLRNNGGGSLKTAIEIAGLFIKTGPIVQVKYRGQDPVVKNDVDPKIQWDGSIVVLVNELSASASEIFAAAMQDYGRAVVIGGNQTYGKGTVQSVIPINNFYPNYEKDLGAIKMTIQKFYRVNGGSTQIEGVYSDIAMPDRYSYMKFGERDVAGALIWDKVPQANYTKTNSYKNFSDVVNNSKERIASDKKFKLINNYAKWLKKNQEDTSYSLNFRKFSEESKLLEKDSKKYTNAFKYQSNLTFKSPQYELPLMKKDSVLADKRNAWHKNLSKDIYVAEALNVLKELKLKDNVEIVKN